MRSYILCKIWVFKSASHKTYSIHQAQMPWTVTVNRAVPFQYSGLIFFVASSETVSLMRMREILWTKILLLNLLLNLINPFFPKVQIRYYANLHTLYLNTPPVNRWPPCQAPNSWQHMWLACHDHIRSAEAYASTPEPPLPDEWFPTGGMWCHVIRWSGDDHRHPTRRK